MAATLKNLREILFTVEPPKVLIDRKTELPFLSESLKERLRKATTREESFAIAEDAKKEMGAEADEVYPNIFIGNYNAVNNVEFLKSKGITHIFNAAEGDGPGMVPALNPEKLDGIEYNAMFIRDNIEANDDGAQIKLFKSAADIIDGIMSKDNTKIVVNCFGGFSRSSCCVLVYLISKKGLTANEALEMIKRKRDVWPSKQNLVHIARMSNEIHGFSDVDVIDDDIEVEDFRKISRNK